LKTALAIAAEGAYFEGHFPGRPILPGVVQLMLVLEALERERQHPVELRKITFARLRQPVLPGQYLEVVSRQIEQGRTRFELTRDGTVITNGELLLGSPVNPMVGSPVNSAPGPVAALPALDDLLPHRAPMRLITSIEGERADGLDCIACVPAGCSLIRNGRASVLAGVEAAAQAAAAWEALRRWRASNSARPRIGYLVAMRDVEFSAQDIPAECAFSVSVRLETAAPPLTYYRFAISLNGLAVAQGLFATFLAVS
jgi:3-hydroxyacyl-[acyl-carrier-protein] dehydratase